MDKPIHTSPPRKVPNTIPQTVWILPLWIEKFLPPSLSTTNCWLPLLNTIYFGKFCPKITFSGKLMLISLFSSHSGIGKNCPSPKSKPNKRYNLYPAHSTMNSREIGAQYNLFWHLLATKRNWGIYSERGKIILQTHWTYLVDIFLHSGSTRKRLLKLLH